MTKCSISVATRRIWDSNQSQ